MAKLLTALKRNRHGHRDWLIGLLIYRHGLRVSEACYLRWDDLDLPKRTIIVRRLKGSTIARITWSGTRSMASSFYSGSRKLTAANAPTSL
jgi:integrase